LKISGVDKLKKETIGTIFVCLALVVGGTGMGYVVGLSQTKTVASNCGDVTCPECPDVNVTTPEVNQTIIHNNVTNIYNYNITNISTDYDRTIEVAADWGACYDFSFFTTDGDCAIPPQISVNQQAKEIWVFAIFDPWMQPDSFGLDFTIKNSAVIGDNASVVSAEIIGNLHEWTVLNITSLEEVYVVARSPSWHSAIAWETSNGTYFSVWTGTQDPGAVARLKPGEWQNLKLTVYFNETELSNLYRGGQEHYEWNQLPIVFRANGEVVEIFNLNIALLWYP
jgi:hypothetical protein